MSSFRRLTNGLRAWFYLTSSIVLASVAAKLGAPAIKQDDGHHPMLRLAEGTMAPVTGSLVEQRWTTEDWHPAEPLVIVDFEPFAHPQAAAKNADWN